MKDVCVPDRSFRSQSERMKSDRVGITLNIWNQSVWNDCIWCAAGRGRGRRVIHKVGDMFNCLALWEWSPSLIAKLHAHSTSSRCTCVRAPEWAESAQMPVQPCSCRISYHCPNVVCCVACQLHITLYRRAWQRQHQSTPHHTLTCSSWSSLSLNICFPLSFLFSFYLYTRIWNPSPFEEKLCN